MGREQRSAEADAWRPLYKTKRWYQTRARQLRDHPLCRMCQEAGRITPATICDHDDHVGKKDPARFFDGPFASLCKTHHDGAKQRQEKRGQVIGCDESGQPLDPQHPWNV